MYGLIITFVLLSTLSILGYLGYLVLQDKKTKNKIDSQFIPVGRQLGLVESGVSNNPDYAHFFDAHKTAGSGPLWQTKTNPVVYINLDKPGCVQACVRGQYNLPWLRLEALQNSYKFPSRGVYNIKLTEIQLEGDFPKYFRLYCEENYEIIALQVFSPEIMQDMIDRHKFCDVEINGSAILYTLDNNKAWSKKFIQSVIDYGLTFDKLARAVNKVTSGLRDS